MGIEPTLEAWEAPVLPLNYTRVEQAGYLQWGLSSKEALTGQAKPGFTPALE